MDLFTFRETLENIKLHKLRTVMTGFGVLWGILSLVVLLGFGEGMKNGVYRGFKGWSQNSIIFWTKRPEVITYDDDLIQDMMKKLPFIVDYSPTLGVSIKSPVRRKNKRLSRYHLEAVKKEIFSINNLNIKSPGRVFNKIDNEERRRVCIIGDNVKKELFNKEEQAVGAYINIDGISFQIIGELDTSKGLSSMTKDNIFIPISTYRYLFSADYHFGRFDLMVKDISIAKAQEEVKNFLANAKGLRKSQMNTIGYFSMGKRIQKINNLFATVNIFIWVVGICFLMSGVVGISNMMMVVVKERTKEIAIRKVIGAKTNQILGMIMIESVIITILSGLTGMVLGVGIIQGTNLLLEHKIDPEKKLMLGELVFKPESAFLAIIALVVAGVFAGFFPAKRATALRPVQALNED